MNQFDPFYPYIIELRSESSGGLDAIIAGFLARVHIC